MLKRWISGQTLLKELDIATEDLAEIILNDELPAYWSDTRFPVDVGAADNYILYRQDAPDKLEEDLPKTLYHMASSLSFKVADVMEFKKRHGIATQVPSVGEVGQSKEVEPSPAISPAQDKSNAGNFFTRENDFWHIGFKGQELRIKHLDGLLYISYLLEKRGVSMSCKELSQAASGATPDKVMPEDTAIDLGLNIGSSTQQVTGYEAKQDYWRYWQKLQDDIDNAEDSPEGVMVKKESKKKQDELMPYLKGRTFADPNDKKAQTNIKKRIDTAYKAIHKAKMKSLLEHLKEHIQPDDAYGLKYTGNIAWVITIK